MAEEQDDKQLSRRARRRAQAEAEAETRDSDEEREVDAGGESADADSDADADEDASADADADAEEEARTESDPSADEDDAPKKLSKSEKKRAKQEAKSATATVRDRNRRLRELGTEKRRSKREREKERRAAVARGLDASEMVDDALARGTHATTQFIRKNSSAIQWVIVLAIAGGIGFQIYSWKTNKASGKASDGLMTGVDAELARVGTEPAGDEAALSPRPAFPTEEARIEAAKKAFDQAEQNKPGSGTSILASLGRAGVLYDEGKYDEAKSLYEKVQSSELARHDADVRLRSIEGVGLCLEAKADMDGANKAFQDLEKSDEPGFSSLGLYHQARLLVQKGDKDKAKELIAKITEKVNKEKSPLMASSYVEKASRDLLAVIDPSTAPASATSYTPEQLDQMREAILKDPTKLKKMLEDMGKLKVPNMPPMQENAPPLPEEPSPAPEEPTPAPPSSGAP
ncbi:MAG: tetratricopeptide repeat protein [Polyangiaceae bacterium]